MYKKNVLGRKYIRIMTDSPWAFISFALIGIALFLFLTLNIKLDVIKTYSAQLKFEQSDVTLLLQADGVAIGTAYIYSNKNEAVYPVLIQKTEKTSQTVILYFNDTDQQRIKTLETKALFIDIPQRKQTLLYRIFINGGNGRG